jgi:hypothetical protein
MAVTGMSRREADDHVENAFAVWETRSLHDWTLDISMITSAGIVAVPPGDRRGISGSRLSEIR